MLKSNFSRPEILITVTILAVAIGVGIDIYIDQYAPQYYWLHGFGLLSCIPLFAVSLKIFFASWRRR